MNVIARRADPREATLAGAAESTDFDFLPPSLSAQCQTLVESFHDLHGYACLPDILWKAKLGPFIETHRELRELLRKASTTRSAKKSNAGFVRIATSILSLEILAGHIAGWSAIYPDAACKAQTILKRHARNAHMPLIEFYLYPPRYPNQTALAALAARNARESNASLTHLPDSKPDDDAFEHLEAARRSVRAEQPDAASSIKA
jgi:hypothetical protein